MVVRIHLPVPFDSDRGSCPRSGQAPPPGRRRRPCSGQASLPPPWGSRRPASFYLAGPGATPGGGPTLPSSNPARTPPPQGGNDGVRIPPGAPQSRESARSSMRQDASPSRWSNGCESRAGLHAIVGQRQTTRFLSEGCRFDSCRWLPPSHLWALCFGGQALFRAPVVQQEKTRLLTGG